MLCSLNTKIFVLLQYLKILQSDESNDEWIKYFFLCDTKRKKRTKKNNTHAHRNTEKKIDAFIFIHTCNDYRMTLNNKNKNDKILQVIFSPKHFFELKQDNKSIKSFLICQIQESFISMVSSVFSIHFLFLLAYLSKRIKA